MWWGGGGRDILEYLRSRRVVEECFVSSAIRGSKYIYIHTFIKSFPDFKKKKKKNC